MKQKKTILGLLMLGLVMIAWGERLPERFLSGYSGFFLGGSLEEIENSLFIPMEKAGFNSVEVKIQQSKQRRMDVFASEAEIAKLAELAQAHGLIFQIYTYPEPYTGRRNVAWPEHAALPALVDAAGITVADAFVLTEFPVWRETFRHVWDLAELSKKYPITAVKFDIETISNSGLSYDDNNWKLFCQSNPSFNVDTPAKERAAALKNGKGEELYRQFFIARFETVVKQIEESLHAINPDLILGFMPAHHGWMANAFIKHLATPATPAIIDDWSMYNGEGFDEKVLEKQKAVKALNANNLYIPWFRGNSYESEDMASLAYHAGSRCDGYSIWSMAMFNEITNKQLGFTLPGNRSAQMYMDAYLSANQAIRQDIAEKTIAQPQRIAYKKSKTLVPPLDFSKTVIPELLPAGSGEIKGSVSEFVLRDQQTIFIYAQTGEEIKVTLRHAAGNSRPLALHYALIDDQQTVLRKESVSPGAADTFSVQAPHSGVFALVVTGGIGGQAWYGVRVFNPYFAVDARKTAYFFGPQTIYTAGANDGNSLLHVGTQDTEAFTYSLNDGEKIAVDRKASTNISLPDGIVKIQFGKSNVAYTQNFFLSFPKGRLPYIYSGSERLLLPPGKTESTHTTKKVQTSVNTGIFPEVIPSGSGAEGKDTTYFILRQDQEILIPARANTAISFNLQHLNITKTQPLTAVLIDRAGTVIGEKTIAAGSKDNVSIKVPADGTYALRLSAGGPGSSWYGVRIFNSHYGFNAAKDTYFFGPQTVYVPGSDFGNPTLLVKMGKGQGLSCSINGAAPVSLKGPDITIELPPGMVKLQFGKIVESGFYSQDFHLSFPNGKLPLIYASPERAVTF